MKRKREEEKSKANDSNSNGNGNGNGNSNNNMEIVWQTPANPPVKEDYIFRDGRFQVKNRWAGKTIVDLFAEEFKGRPYDYYVSAVKCGRIQVDGEMVPVSYTVKSSQKISHFLHRHEPPVMAWDVSVLQKEPDVLTVCKPPSVPVHPCGQYRKNTVVGILQAEHDLAPLFPVHRLDRLVSGLLILARNASKADLFRQQIEAGKVIKRYIARVNGVFPEGEQVVDVNINYNASAGRSTAESGDSLGDTPLKGKAACTKFTRISTNGTHSIVLCEPITGRTHQIRVHLQYTGYPIANDMLYLCEHVTHREGMSADRAAAYSHHSPPPVSSDKSESSSEDFSIDPMCTNCPNLAPKGFDLDKGEVCGSPWMYFQPPLDHCFCNCRYEGHEEGLWLHCVRYSGPGWTYECPYPDWATLSL
ncbi:RNA pseudouridine synthase 7 [Citrus sinensis]|uniref:RNA pseudouridine synthase 7 n=1 Tax=Citrus sinensis TaxID=2711 RepID=A0ACB8L9I9_CITSI|nr:RNA pseudouridine synthase 7 [Citrus sinensis]